MDQILRLASSEDEFLVNISTCPVTIKYQTAGALRRSARLADPGGFNQAEQPLFNGSTSVESLQGSTKRSFLFLSKHLTKQCCCELLRAAWHRHRLYSLNKTSELLLFWFCCWNPVDWSTICVLQVVLVTINSGGTSKRTDTCSGPWREDVLG